MREADLTGWLDRVETKMLLAYLGQRRAGAVQQFLNNQPVDPQTQGRAAAFHELEKLLTSPVENVRKTFEIALREHKAS